MADDLSQLLNLHEVELLAARRMSRMAFDFCASGAGDEYTLSDNRHAYNRLALAYRVLVNVEIRDLATTVLGQRVAMPVLIAPTAFQQLAHAEAELATARAAAAAGTIMVVSTFATRTFEAIRKVSTGALWLQLYIFKDRGLTHSLIQRAEAAGYTHVVLTVDAPILGPREIDIRNSFQLPDGMAPANLESWPAGGGKIQSGSQLAAYFTSSLDPGLTWKDVEWLRSITRMPVLVKGIVRADDGLRAMEHGAAGVIVSNHGGRQLDTAPATIRVLPDIVDVVAGRGEVLVDGGVRRGTDIVKAIALGAKGVLLGRPILWGLAIGGPQGVTRVLDLIRYELDSAMALCGCPSIPAIKRDLVIHGA